MGVDWGKHNDWTSLTVICRDCRRVVDWDRFNEVDYAYQRRRLAALARKWGCAHVLAESNAMGEPNIEELQRAGLPVAGFATTATSKPPLVESLALALEQGQLAVPVDYVGELQAYEQARNAITNRPTYGAPRGMHDDRVMSLALAWRAAESGLLEVF
jgi:hypothetical protein